ncbi:hypothetical protein DB32_007968 [Sandaracinus amylolyticus]|uniref:GST N-terminal domain-containing protein n=1 Tax=Sandaracinus amylolyticus TaxID=927083 RepID=A0A0F6SHP8_9BACT|nr:hypothetical protein DB32_007968 [Sandaracinus amylolyticus]
MQIVGRSSSHFTRMCLIFAHELEVPFELVPVHDMTRLDAEAYGGHPALKVPALRCEDRLVFGAQNVCRVLAERAGATERVVWPEQLRDDVSRNAQELVWHCMSAQVQLVVGTGLAKLPADNLYFTKARGGFEGALRWLDEHLEAALSALQAQRALSVFEVSLFCLIEHLGFRPTLPLEPYPSLVRFARELGARPSAERTAYRFDAPA